MSQTSQANVIGAVWMVAAMAAFAVEDSLLKRATLDMPIGQMLVGFGLGGTLLFAAVVRWRREAFISRDTLSPPMRLRVVFEMMGRLFYGLAIALTPLSAATVILQATPLVVVASAAILFGEGVGWRRWAAIFLGLLGVIIILRPGMEGFSPLSLLAIIGMIGFAGRDLASRAAPKGLSPVILGFYGFLAIIPAGAAYALWDGTAFVIPALPGTLALVGGTIVGVFAYTCLMRAMRTGEVSAVTPFRYTRLIFGVALGVVFFGEPLDAPMVLGSVLIVLSGLFILWRSRS